LAYYSIRKEKLANKQLVTCPFRDILLHCMLAYSVGNERDSSMKTLTELCFK